MPALQAMSGEIVHALEHINVPSYVIDAAGVIRWVNPAASRLVGDVVGRQFTSIVAPEDTRRARELFARKILATSEVTDASVVVVDEEGTRVAVELSSVPLMAGDHVVGVFGQVSDIVEEPSGTTFGTCSRRSVHGRGCRRSPSPAARRSRHPPEHVRPRERSRDHPKRMTPVAPGR